jgi:hypothetical protein
MDQKSLYREQKKSNISAIFLPKELIFTSHICINLTVASDTTKHTVKNKRIIINPDIHLLSLSETLFRLYHATAAFFYRKEKNRIQGM